MQIFDVDLFIRNSSRVLNNEKELTVWIGGAEDAKVWKRRKII